MDQSKAKSRRRTKELRGIVNRWDPIGVFFADPNWPPDEYDCIVGPLMRLLEEGRPAADIIEYLETEVRDHFGSSPVPGAAAQCAEESVAWFQKNDQE